MADMVLQWGNPPTGVQNAPVYLGLARGALGGQGVRLQVTDTATGAEHTRALLDGAFDLGHIGAPPLIAALGRTRSHGIVATGLFRHPPHSLVAAPGVRELRELRGSTVAINHRGTCSESIFLALTARERLGGEEIALATLGDGPAIVAAIRRAEVGGAVLWEPYTSMVQRELGWGILTEGRAVWSPSRYCTLLYARRTLMQEAPGLVAGIIRAYGACVRSAQMDTAAAAEAVIERMPQVPAADVRRGVIHEAPAWSDDTSLDQALMARVLGEPEVQARMVDGFRIADAILPV